MRKLWIALLMMAFSWNALAHSPMQMTVPEDGASLDIAPTEIVLVFKRNIRLTKVVTSHANSGDVQLDLEGRKSFATEFKIPFNSNNSGEHQINWLGLGDDRHIQKGSFVFMVR